jgi:hypothetical protein
LFPSAGSTTPVATAKPPTPCSPSENAAEAATTGGHEETTSTLEVATAEAKRAGAEELCPAGTVTVTGFGAFALLDGSAVSVTLASFVPASKSTIEGRAGSEAAAGGTTQAGAATELPEVEAPSCEVSDASVRTAAATPPEAVI